MNGDGKGIEGAEVGLPRNWVLWTVWSTELGALMDCCELSTMEFAGEIISAVQEKDGEFHLKGDEDIKVIRPTKLLDINKEVGTGAVKVEIGGTIFRPGTRNDDGGFGKRWRLIASNKLAVVFHADKNFIPAKLYNEIFVIINGRVLESSRQILLDDSDRETKIIRLIDEQIKPGKDDRYLRVSHMFRNYWKYRGSRKHVVLQVIPYSAFLNTEGISKSLERELSENLLRTPEPNDESTPVKHACSSKTCKFSKDTSGDLPKSSEFEDLVKTDKNNNALSNRSVVESRIGKNSVCEILKVHDGEIPIVKNGKSHSHSPAFTGNLSKTGFSTVQEKSPDIKLYSKLIELERELKHGYSVDPRVNVSHSLKNRHVYGIVEEVIQVPRETDKTSEMYVLRISDETKNNVLVRLCTGKQRSGKPSVLSKIGPPVNCDDIIRIHRAVVQFETYDSSSLEEMVISVSTHFNYVIFNNVRDISAPVEYVRLAKDTEVLKDGDEDIIRNLRRFSASRMLNFSSSPSTGSSTDMFYDSRSHFSSESDDSFLLAEEAQINPSVANDSRFNDQNLSC